MSKNNLDITHRLLSLLDQAESRLTYVPDRPGHDRRYSIDATKLQSQLGWTPAISFETGLAETVAWYQANQTWIEHIEARQQREKLAPGAAWLANGS